MQIYCFDPAQFSSFEEAVKGKGKIRALSILFEVIIIHRFHTLNSFFSHMKYLCEISKHSLEQIEGHTSQ